MKNKLRLFEVKAAGALIIALGLAGCTASGMEPPKNDELYHTVQIEPEPTLPIPAEQTEQRVVFDVISGPEFTTNGVHYVITDGDIQYAQEASCSDYDLQVWDPDHLSVKPTLIPESRVCVDGKLTKSDWRNVLDVLQLGEATE